MAVRVRLLTAALLAAALTGCASRVVGHGTLDLGELEPNCPGQTATIKGLPLEQAVLPSTDKHLPLDNANSGPESVDDLVEGYDDKQDQADVRRELTQAGWVESWSQVWSTGTYDDKSRRVEVVEVTRFATPQGACRFARDSRLRDDLTETTSAVPGSYGYDGGGGTDRSDPKYSGLEATKGPYYISANALSAGADVSDWPESMLKAQYDRL
jgi:hypothetical protein